MKYIAILFIVHTSCLAQLGLRTLTDVEGRTIDVRILAVRETSVFVEMLDGREFDIPFERLVMSDLIYLDSWEPPPVQTPENPIDSVVIFKSEDTSASGFFAHESGRTFVYTNQHVISEALDVRAYDVKGNPVKLGELQVSNSCDMARYRVDVDIALRLQDDVRPDQNLVVLGNSEGAGVITSDRGTVRGIGPKEIEVDAEFVPGNSGGPVLNLDKEVIGMATYLKRMSSDQPSWITEDTRYGKARRFILRPTRVNDWVTVDPAEYARQNAELVAMQEKIDQAIWTYLVLTNGEGMLSEIPENWEREITGILKSHNRRQERQFYDGTYTGTSVRSNRENKDNSRRSNIRALERYLQGVKREFYGLNNAKLTLGYFKTNPYNGSQALERQVDVLLRQMEM